MFVRTSGLTAFRDRIHIVYISVYIIVPLQASVSKVFFLLFSAFWFAFSREPAFYVVLIIRLKCSKAPY